MEHKARIFASIAAAGLLSLLPQTGMAQSGAMSQSADNTTTQANAQLEAERMVPAEVALSQELDARKLSKGTQFRAALQGKVKLKNGTELPRGTVLTGTVATDQAGSPERLALRFTSAELKGGKQIPIEATIVGVAGPATMALGDYDANDTSAESIAWNGKDTRMDEEGVKPGVDLHSSIGDANSGVFVATGDHDVKFQEGSRIALALCAETSGNSKRAGGA